MEKENKEYIKFLEYKIYLLEEKNNNMKKNERKIKRKLEQKEEIIKMMKIYINQLKNLVNNYIILDKIILKNEIRKNKLNFDL